MSRGRQPSSEGDHERAKPSASPGLIGPNAATQLAAALRTLGEPGQAERVFAAAGLADWLETPPAAMIDERLAARLHRQVRDSVSPRRAEAILDEAGRLTADYILANRIPRLAQMALKALPAPLAARLLMRAIRAHAWTFAGSGRFEGQIGRQSGMAIVANPLCAGESSPNTLCVWHTAVFRRLFAALASPAAEVVETECRAQGSDCCRFALRLSAAATAPAPAPRPREAANSAASVAAAHFGRASRPP